VLHEDQIRHKRIVFLKDLKPGTVVSPRQATIWFIFCFTLLRHRTCEYEDLAGRSQRSITSMGLVSEVALSVHVMVMVRENAPMSCTPLPDFPGMLISLTTGRLQQLETRMMISTSLTGLALLRHEF
jgi:hypothetical protein